MSLTLIIWETLVTILLPKCQEFFLFSLELESATSITKILATIPMWTILALEH
jgi:hypothetical protein